jgi:predicted AAA+ superfamily ATPase
MQGQGGHHQRRLLEAIAAWRPGRTMSVATHKMATKWFHRYSMVGGMPAVVAADVQGAQPRRCRELQRDLLATYRADFARYSGRMDRTILDRVLAAVAASIGAKFVYSRGGEGVKHHQAKRALELLADARLCHLVRHSAGDGTPLGATAKEKRRKAILLDVGLLHALVGTPATTTFPSLNSLAPGLRGRLADQLAGQQLRLVEFPRNSGVELVAASTAARSMPRYRS